MRVVQRGPGGHDVDGIKASRKRLQMDQCANQEARSGEQENGQSDFAGK